MTTVVSYEASEGCERKKGQRWGALERRGMQAMEGEFPPDSVCFSFLLLPWGPQNSEVGLTHSPLPPIFSLFGVQALSIYLSGVLKSPINQVAGLWGASEQEASLAELESN